MITMQVFNLTIWCRPVDFLHQNRWNKRRPEMEKIPRRSTRNCTPPPAKKDATSFKEMQTPSCLQVLSGGPLRGQLFTIYRKFALCFQWRDPLPAHPDCDFVNELFHDINFGVRIGFNHDRIPCFPQITLPQPLTLRPSHRNWNAKCP